MNIFFNFLTISKNYNFQYSTSILTKFINFKLYNSYISNQFFKLFHFQNNLINIKFKNNLFNKIQNQIIYLNNCNYTNSIQFHSRQYFTTNYSCFELTYCEFININLNSLEGTCYFSNIIISIIINNCNFINCISTSEFSGIYTNCLNNEIKKNCFFNLTSKHISGSLYGGSCIYSINNGNINISNNYFIN